MLPVLEAGNRNEGPVRQPAEMLQRTDGVSTGGEREGQTMWIVAAIFATVAFFGGFVVGYVLGKEDAEV